MFSTEISDSKSQAQEKPVEHNSLLEDSGMLDSAISGFKKRAAEAASDSGDTIARSAVSLAVGGAVALATRGRGWKTGMALGSAAAAGLQAAWSLAFDEDTPAEKAANEQKPFVSRVANQIGETSFDALALGALPGMLGSGMTRSAVNYFDIGAGKHLASSLAHEAPLGRAASTVGETAGLIPTRLEQGGKVGALADDALKLKAELVPLNAWSRSTEQIGRDISNFGHTPFWLDGKKYESVEGFYSGLLYNDPVRRAKIAEMWGLEAKLAGRSSNLEVTRYGKQMIKLGSEDHHQLIERAIRAKFEQNPRITEAFVETHPRPIIHDVGAADKPGAHYPRAVLEGVLTKIRDEYVAAKKLIGS